MSRRIMLLTGDRSSTQDVAGIDARTFLLRTIGGETDKLTIDCTRWLDGATVTATTSAGFLSLSVSSPNVTVTVTGSDGPQYGDVLLTASDGRVRKVTIETRNPNETTFDAYDYRGWW